MRKINLLACLAIVLLGTTLMSAQATRTWVSGVGDDANPCSRTAPCKTFAGAISKTAPGGEIDALDPGGFGALTITKSITLDGGGGQVASVLVAGTNGIVVATSSPNDVVIIRNLRFDGLLGGGNGNAGLSGIRLINPIKELDIENVYVTGFSNAGIDLEPSGNAAVTIINTVIENIGTCVPASCLTAQGVGIFASASGGTAKVAINNSTVTTFSNNGVQAAAGAIVSFDNGSITGGNNGVTSSGGGSLIISRSTIAYNSGVGYNGPSGNIFAYATSTTPNTGTNRVHDNGGGNGTPTYILGN
ncbi:MAG TPA: hypothetical protein VI685_07570 [Candidatus Angelobacter sp.]